LPQFYRAISLTSPAPPEQSLASTQLELATWREKAKPALAPGTEQQEAVVRSQLVEQCLGQGCAYEKLKETSKTLIRAQTGETSAKYRMGSSQVLYGGEICW